MPVFEMLGNVNSNTKSFLKCCLGCIHRPNLVSLPTTNTSCADVSAQGLDGAQPTLISTALNSPLQVMEFEMLSLTCF